MVSSMAPHPPARRPMVSSMAPSPLLGDPWCLLWPHLPCSETHGVFYGPVSPARRPMVSSMAPSPLLGDLWHIPYPISPETHGILLTPPPLPSPIPFQYK